MSEPPVPYRQYYHPKEQVDQDSVRARRRITAYLAGLESSTSASLARACELNLGERPGSIGMGAID